LLGKEHILGQTRIGGDQVRHLAALLKTPDHEMMGAIDHPDDTPFGLAGAGAALHADQNLVAVHGLTGKTRGDEDILAPLFVLLGLRCHKTVAVTVHADSAGYQADLARQGVTASF
jgi:hypothetical protein